MGISDFVEKLQNKPRQLRVLILWSSVAICMTIIFILWVWSFDTGPVEQSETNQKYFSQSSSLEETKKEIPSLWQSLKGSVLEIINSVKQNSNQSQIEIMPQSEEVPPAELPK